VGRHRARCTRLPHTRSHRRRGSAPHPRGAGTVRRRCAQGPHRGRREAAERRDKGNSGLRDSSQKGRRRRPTGSPRSATRRPRIANWKTEDERTRCGAAAGFVAPAGSPAHANGEISSLTPPPFRAVSSRFVIRLVLLVRGGFENGCGADCWPTASALARSRTSRICRMASFECRTRRLHAYVARSASDTP
jgi:hypothetical protein